MYLCEAIGGYNVLIVNMRKNGKNLTHNAGKYKKPGNEREKLPSKQL